MSMFLPSAIVAVIATLMVVTRANAVHALLYLVVSLLAIAMIFASLGAPFAAALEIIIYAGAIVILFLFVVMMLNVSHRDATREARWLAPQGWVGPGLLATVLALELVYTLGAQGLAAQAGTAIGPEQVGLALFGPYLLAVEIASILLLAGLIGAFHLGRAVGERSES